MHKTHFERFVAIMIAMSAVYQFKVRVGVILVVADKLLLVRQNDRPFWVLPGGTLEPGEGLDACGIRELKEECNLDIHMTQMRYLSDFVQSAGKQTIDVFFLAKLACPDGLSDYRLSTEENLNEAGFFTLAEAKAMRVQPQRVFHQVLSDWEQGWPASPNPYLGSYHPD